MMYVAAGALGCCVGLIAGVLGALIAAILIGEGRD